MTAVAEAGPGTQAADDLDPAQRAYVSLAADLSRAYPGAEVWWTPAGFHADWDGAQLGPVSSPSALDALLGAERRRRERGR